MTLVAAGLTLSLLTPHAIMAACVCAMLYGAVCLWDGTWTWEPRDNPAAAVNFSIVVFALGSAAICWLKSEPSGELEPYLSLLGAPLLGVGLRRLELKPSMVGASLAAAAILGACVGVWQVVNASETHRASTQVAATSFGMLGAVYAVICTAMVSWSGPAHYTKAILRTGAIAGIVVAILSGSRGSWLIFAVVLPVAIFLGFAPGNRRKGVTVCLALVLVGAASALLPNNSFADRVRETLRVGDPLRAAFSRESFKAFVSAPLGGMRRDDFAANLDRAWLSIRPYAPHESPPQHAHNELLDAAAVRGIGGLLLNILVLAVPVIVLWHLAKKENGTGPAKTGLLCMAAFLLAGTTDLLLQLTARRMTFLFFVLFFVIAATATSHAPAQRRAAH
ncbi:MAG: hypothetical protein RIQ71_683 [Verrucomicrobiota bacterium]|jgi:O-antigen ligase